MKHLPRYLALLTAIWTLSSCTVVPKYSHANKPLPSTAGAGLDFDPLQRASEVVPWRLNSACRNRADAASIGNCQHDDEYFVAIAISGGGSRSAVFGAAVLFELQRYGLLGNTDVITCVSGGCITAAYYALSCAAPDPSQCMNARTGTPRPDWHEDTIYDLLTRNYELRWFGNWFWPDNIARYWFTYYDRTDIMAETLSNNLYDTSTLSIKPFLYMDLNPARPNLIISSTNGAAADEAKLAFLFTKERFRELKSDLGRYPIANAVMASATFPGAFQYVTLRDYANKRYLHLFDGGTWDNLGLTAVNHVMKTSLHDKPAPAHSLVISIDAFPLLHGKDDQDPEPRDFVDYFVDSNFLDAFDTLLTSVRDQVVKEAQNQLTGTEGRTAFTHITFTDLVGDPEHEELLQVVRKVSTDFSVKPYQAQCLRRAAQILVRRKIRELSRDPRFSQLIHMQSGEPLMECNPPPGRST